LIGLTLPVEKSSGELNCVAKEKQKQFGI
jgi:hypothetical protein